ncbi:MAG: amidohydrolase family protein [Flavobacteriales bacterium]|nr:amidohydrolase family protein [Flavobacteriales bacterium]
MARPVNVHSHVFTGQCAPDYFLRTALPKVLDPFAPQIKVFIEKQRSRGLIKAIARLNGSSKLLRYIQFAEMGLQETQETIFLQMKRASSALGPDTRFIALTLNMDHMGTGSSSHGRIEDQLDEVERLRSHFPDHFFPFISVDPRHLGGEALKEWVRVRVERLGFFGIKLYPSLGFFPFDERLDALYAWAAEKEVPVMTHCTRHGVFYTGKMSEVLGDLAPRGLNPGHPAMGKVHERIKRFRNSRSTWNAPKHGCNIFTHPDNYLPVLDKYRKLKICFAHFGGDDEMLPGKHKQPLRDNGLDPTNWHELVLAMMRKPRDPALRVDADDLWEWPNVYADISYTLYNEEVYTALQALIKETHAGDRILFGTDFYMTLREDKEETLLDRCMVQLGTGPFRKIAEVNTQGYLGSKYFDPSRRFIA